MKFFDVLYKGWILTRTPSRIYIHHEKERKRKEPDSRKNVIKKVYTRFFSSELQTSRLPAADFSLLANFSLRFSCEGRTRARYRSHDDDDDDERRRIKGRAFFFFHIFAPLSVNFCPRKEKEQKSQHTHIQVLREHFYRRWWCFRETRARISAGQPGSRWPWCLCQHFSHNTYIQQPTLWHTITKNKIVAIGLEVIEV